MLMRSTGNSALPRIRTRRSRLVVLGAGLLPVLVALAACDQISAEQRIENARAFVQQGAADLAIAELKHALQEAPDDARLRLMLGKLYLSGGDLPYADKELSRARALGLESPDLLLTLGELWLRQQRPERLLEELAPRPGWQGDARAAALGLRARAYLGLDDLAGARSAYRAILELDPGSVDARIGLVRVAMRADDLGAAEPLLAGARRIAPDQPALLGLSGDLAFRLARYPDAVGLYRKRLEAAPDDATARLALAEALLAAGELAEAEALLDRLLAERPGNGLANYLRAAAAFQAGKVEVARVHGERAAAAIPTHVPSMFLAGAASYARGRFEAAHRHLTRALAREPDHAPARLLLEATNQQLALTQPDAERWDGGERLFRVDLAAVQSGDFPETEKAAAAGRLARAGEHAQAARLLNRVAGPAPDAPSVLELEGGLALLAGRPGAAARVLEAALERRPAPVLARKLALAERRAGDEAAARATLEAWLARAPDDLETRLVLAEVHLAADRPAAAREQLMKVVTVRPTDPGALNNLAWALLEEGRAGAARGYAERAFSLAPHEPRVMDTLALVLIELGQLDPAIELLRRAAWAEVADPAIEAHLAQALARRGEGEEAREILLRLLADPAALPERDQVAAEALLRDLGG